MPVNVDTNGNLGLADGHNRVTFRNPRGTKYYYCVWADDENPERINVKRSEDGVTWSASQGYDLFGSSGHVESYDVKISEDSGNSQLELWFAVHGYSSNDTETQVQYIYGTIADAAVALNWSRQVAVAGITNILSDDHCVALARTDNGEIVIAFTEDITLKGKDYRYTKLIGSDGDGASPSWSGEIIWDDPTGDSNNQNKGTVYFGLENFSSSYPDSFLIYARVPESTTTTYSQAVSAVPDWDQGGSGFTNTTQATIESGYLGVAAIITGLIDESDITHVVYISGISSDVLHKKAGSAGDDNWGSSTAIETTTTAIAATIALDTGPSTDEIYIFWHGLTDLVDFHYRVSPVDTIAFGPKHTVSFHADITALSSWNRVIENSLHIVGVYGTNIFYSEQPVYKALSTTLADLVFPDQNYYLGPHST